MRKYISIFFASVGGKWFLLPGFVSGCAGVIAILRGLGLTWVPEVSYWALAVFVVLPMSIWSIPALIRTVVKLQDRLEPKVEIRFEPKNPWVVRVRATTPSKTNLTNSVETDAIFFRIQVLNPQPNTTVTRCVAYLANVLMLDEQGNSIPTNYGDSLRLRWAARQPYLDFAPVNIPHGTNIYLDLFSVDAEHNTILVKWDVPLNANAQLFDRPGEYRLDVLVETENGGAVKTSIGVRWTGQWENTEAWQIQEST